MDKLYYELLKVNSSIRLLSSGEAIVPGRGT